VALGVKQHCAFEGMTRDEVANAIGQPAKKDTKDGAESWTYVTQDKNRCKQFRGESCVEYEEASSSMIFTPSGNVITSDTGSGCQKEPLLSKLIELEIGH